MEMGLRASQGSVYSIEKKEDALVLLEEIKEICARSYEDHSRNGP